MSDSREFDYTEHGRDEDEVCFEAECKCGWHEEACAHKNVARETAVAMWERHVCLRWPSDWQWTTTCRARVYRAGPDTTLPPCWLWRCTCGQGGHSNIGLPGSRDDWLGCLNEAWKHLIAVAMWERHVHHQGLRHG